MIILTINGRNIKTEAEKTVLEAALEAGIYIPSLCYHPDLAPIGACRLCIVEIEGVEGFPTSCTAKVKEGMVVRTDTPKLKKLRKDIIWFILSEHPKELGKSSALEKVARYVGLKDALRGYQPRPKGLPVVSGEPLFIRDPNRCILCERCVRMCQDIRGIGAIGLTGRGIDTLVSTNYYSTMKDSGCKFCMACVEVCPSGALIDKEEIKEADREKKLLPCKGSCPAEIDVARYVRLIAEGRFQDSLEVIREKVPFPHVLGYVCTHPCEEECFRGEVNEPIAIRALKRFVAERDSLRWKSKIVIAPETGKKVAIVGSGPAGLTAGWFLRKAGHTATVFEAMPQAGGMMRMAIPLYRLPRNILDQEIKDIENIGVKIKTDTKIDSLDTLFDGGFDAVFLATGAPFGIKMGIPGEEDPRVLDGLSVLKAINLSGSADITGEVIVIGGGNVAIDTSRSALKAGAKKVTVLYRRTEKEMPALPEEVEEAKREGVKITFLAAPQKVLAGHKKLNIECIRMKLGEPDSSGRRRPIPIKGSEFVLKADRLIMAIGQKSDKTLSCSRQGVFQGGDVASGPASVIEAIGAGRKAAISIDRYLGGKGQIDQRFIPEEKENPWLGREEDFAYRKRMKISAAKRDIGKKEAVKEAERCLRCQLRLKISRAPLPECVGQMST